MASRLLLTSLFISLCSSTYAQDYEPPLTEWGVPDFQGVWKHSSLIPFERPPELEDRRAYTDAEAAGLERAAQALFEEDAQPLDPNRGAPQVDRNLPPRFNYDHFWREDATVLPTINGELRTSAIIDPTNGRMPPRLPWIDEFLAERERDRNREDANGLNNDGPEGRTLAERCLVAFGPLAGPVMMPVIYNSHLHFVQSPGYVTIAAEMVHDARIIKITNQRNPAAEHQQKWMGDSIGRWEGDTLVAETKSFNPWHRFQGFPVEQLKVTETFRLESPGKLIYGFTVVDPNVFTDTFSGEYPFSRSEESIYEYACHEGNYALEGILAGARRGEVERARQ